MASSSSSSSTSAALAPPATEEHPLWTRFTLWFYRKTAGTKAVDTFERHLKNLGTFDTVEGFWRIYTYLVRPGDLPMSSDYFLFREGVKPMWEDKENSSGGRSTVRIPKSQSSRHWESLMLSFLGGEFGTSEELCGINVSVRYNEDHLLVWNKLATNTEVCRHIHTKMLSILGMDDVQCKFDYKRNNDTITDYMVTANAAAPGAPGAVVPAGSKPASAGEKGSTSDAEGKPAPTRRPAGKVASKSGDDKNEDPES